MRIPIAGWRGRVTFQEVARNGIAARKQAELKNRRLRAVGPGSPPVAAPPADKTRRTDPAAVGILSRVLDVPAPGHADTRVEIRTLDQGGRFRLDVFSELGWEPGVRMTAGFDGPWLVVTPGPGPAPSSRRVTYDKARRFHIPHGLRARLGVGPGVAVVVRLQPGDGAVAVAPTGVVAAALDLYERVRKLPRVGARQEESSEAEVS